jgi:Amt family ammonium transporter
VAVSPLWLLTFGVAAVLVRLGLALLTCGAVRRASATATLTRAATESAVATLAFWAIGAPLLLGHAGGIASFDTGLILSQSTDVPNTAASEVYHWAVVLIASAVVSAAVAERARARVGLAASAVLGGVVVPIAGHWVWFGWLRQRDMVDFGGATVVHLTAAVFAAVGAAAVGSRAGRYGPGAAPMTAHSGQLVGAGVAVAVLGWFPYLMGAMLAHPTSLNAVEVITLAITAMNVPLAAAGGLLGGLMYAKLRRSRPGQRSRAFCGYTGLLGGLVAVSAGCVAVGNLGAVLIGVAAGVLVPAAANLLDRRARLDDPVGLVSVHGVGAIWGTLAAALFASNQASSRLAQVRLLGVQVMGLAAVLALATVTAGVTFALLRLVGPLRVDADEERLGLDVAEGADIT